VGTKLLAQSQPHTSAKQTKLSPLIQPVLADDLLLMHNGGLFSIRIQL